MTKHNFEAETWKILEMLTHSIYSNKEIFLRELVSNSSDAIDKAKLKSLTDTNFLWDDTEFKIKIEADKKNNAIIITDNWIWMTEKELQSNLWTIAKSWTQEFIKKLEKAKEDGEHNLIWQFWVWFYSSFMVADKVEVESKSALNKKSHKWTSDWKNWYELKETDKKSRWTKITLFIDETNKELLEDWKIRELVKKYSNYVGVPIMMMEIDTRTDEEKKKEKKVFKLEQINETKAIWKKSKSELKKWELNEFYKSISMDYNEPLTNISANIEWMVSYKSLLFVPKEKNMFANMSDPTKEYWPKLYIQNILILENAKELLPIWLRFVSWVVETTDLPLNISREMLQSNSTLEKIKSGLIKKVLNWLKTSMKKDTEDYNKFLENFWEVLKEWIHYEHNLKEQISEVVKFKSMNLNKLVSLDDYLDKNLSENPDKKEEKIIYYIVWKSESEVLASPYLTQFRENNVDVLLLTDPIDSWIVKALTQYKWSTLKQITASDIKLKEETKEETKKKEEAKKEYKDFLEFTKNLISADKIEKVELNENLWNAISALKTQEWWVEPQMEKMMKAMWQPVPPQKRILELNPNISLIKGIKEEFKKDIKSEKLKDMIMYSYNSAVLLEWWELENIADFVKLTNKFAGEYI